MKIKVHIQPHDKQVEVRQGSTFLGAAIAARISLQHRCGGNGICGTCKVKIESGKPLCDLTPREKWILTEELIRDGYRLSCQCKVLAESTMEIPEDPLKRLIRIRLEEAKRQSE